MSLSVFILGLSYLEADSDVASLSAQDGVKGLWGLWHLHGVTNETELKVFRMEVKFYHVGRETCNALK